MKKIFFFFLLLIITIFTINVTTAHAITLTTKPSPETSTSPTPNISNINQQIENLKDRIASRVAQLKLVEKRGIIGTVTDVTETQITISDIQGNTRYIDVDELTKFSSPSAKDGFGISDITKGSIVGILGLYNKESRRILARFVDVLVLPEVISGAVTNLDRQNYTLTVTTPEGKDIVVDIETITKTSVYGKDTGLTKSGFSKIQNGERIFVAGYPEQQNKNKIMASRIIRLPDIPINPKIPLAPTEQPGITPSTGSGIKLVPIIKK